jgi:hypothetical protein
MKQQNARQGDIIIKAISSLPDGTKPASDLILAHGEVTGHAHRITEGHATLLEREGQRFLSVTAPTTVMHEEHDTITLEAGFYEVMLQREFSSEDWDSPVRD